MHSLALLFRLDLGFVHISGHGVLWCSPVWVGEGTRLAVAVVTVPLGVMLGGVSDGENITGERDACKLT